MSFSTSPGSTQNAARNIYGNLLPLDLVFQESMEKVKSGFDLIRIVVRCEPLPQIYGEKQALNELFENLIRMILSSSPPGYKLFLFVGCDVQKDQEPKNNQQEMNTFLIRFHTNITTGEEWKSQNAAAIHRCNFIIASHN